MEEVIEELTVAHALLRLHRITRPGNRILTRQLPDHMPFDLPIPEGATIVGWLVGDNFAEIVIHAQASVDEIKRLYQSHYANLDWRIEKGDDVPFELDGEADEDEAEMLADWEWDRAWMTFVSPGRLPNITLQGWEREQGGIEYVLQILPKADDSDL